MSDNARENFHLEVYPRSAGDFGLVFMSGIHRTPKEAKYLAEQMKKEILRHVEDVGTVTIIWDE